MRPALKPVLLLALCAAAPASALDAGLGEPPPPVERDNPSSTVHGFLNAAHAGKYDLAAWYLDLDFLPRDRQPIEGPRLARRLKFVLDRKVFIDFSEISKEPTGDPRDPKWDQIGAVRLGNTNQPLRLVRVEAGDGQPVWVFSPETVKSIDRLYAAYGPPLGDSIPDVLFRHSVLELEPWQWIGVALVLGLALPLGLAVEWLLLALGRRMAKLTLFTWEERLVPLGRGPLRVPVWAAAVEAGTRALLLTPAAQHLFDHLCYSGVIVALAWLLLRALGLLAVSVQSTVSGASGTFEERRFQGVRTQLAVLRRIAAVAVYVLGAALLLMQFEVVRHVGVSILASAGVAGLVLGLAAQRSISTLLAGIQLTITRPISLGDTVVVEGESGTVEEITLTYVIIQLWDQRRLIIPMNWFLEKPFQNWSKGATERVTTVTLLVHREADVESFRAELRRALEGEGRALWDGRIPNLIATEGPDHTLILRAVAGAAQRDSSGPLRRLLSARLEALLQAHPEWLPPSSVVPRGQTPSRGAGEQAETPSH